MAAVTNGKKKKVEPEEPKDYSDKIALVIFVTYLVGFIVTWGWTYNNFCDTLLGSVMSHDMGCVMVMSVLWPLTWPLYLSTLVFAP